MGVSFRYTDFKNDSGLCAAKGTTLPVVQPICPSELDPVGTHSPLTIPSISPSQSKSMVLTICLVVKNPVVPAYSCPTGKTPEITPSQVLSISTICSESKVVLRLVFTFAMFTPYCWVKPAELTTLLATVPLPNIGKLILPYPPRFPY